MLYEKKFQMFAYTKSIIYRIAPAKIKDHRNSVELLNQLHYTIYFIYKANVSISVTE
jgi:hypothetical protein